MDSRIILTGIACTILCCHGCGSKSADTDTYDTYEKPDTVNGIQQMKDYHYSAEVKDRNTVYTYDIVREVSDSLPVVEGEENVRFADNYIRLRVNRDGREIFNKVFTKQTFADKLDKDFFRHSILEGMAFDRLQPEGLRFSASVSYPESDIYMPFSVLVARDGSYRITKEEILDTTVPEDSTATE